MPAYAGVREPAAKASNAELLELELEAPKPWSPVYGVFALELQAGVLLLPITDA